MLYGDRMPFFPVRSVVFERKEIINMKGLSMLLVLALLLGACGTAPAPTGGITFTDDLGRTVTVQEPQRVAALLGSFAQIWMLSGGTVCATADDAWEDLALDLPADAVNLGNIKELSLELLLASQPDLVLASTNTRQHLEWKQTLEAAGIPVAYFDVADFDGYLRLLKLCTQITGRDDLYETHGLRVQEQIEAVLEKRQGVEAPTVLCMRASASSISVKNSQDNVLGEMLHSLGCINIADVNASLLDTLSMEYILQADPDFIFLVQRGDDAKGMRDYVARTLESDPVWSRLTAVQEGRVYFMDKHLYNLKPNHRWGEAYEKLEEILSNG